MTTPPAIIPSPPPANPVGRPYIERETLFAVCDAIAAGANLRPACESVGVSAQCFFDRVARDSELFDSYRMARHVRASDQAEETLEIAKQVIAGKVPADAARVAIQASQWVAARWGRSEYSETSRVAVEVAQPAQEELDLSLLTDEELDQYEAIAAKSRKQLPPS